MFVDTHTHLYADSFDADREALIRKAIGLDVKRFYLPNIDKHSIDMMLALEARHPEHCFPMMGLHPCHVNATVEDELKVVRSWLDRRSFIGIGEIGLDLYWDKTFFAQQEHAFRTQMRWAVEFGYPVSIHCREAFDELYAILSSLETRPKAVFHCFSGTPVQAQKIIDLGNFKLGIGGVVTFKNGGLDKVVEQLALEHFVLETDAPYLAPVPFRGKRNEPSYLLEVAKKMAAIKDLPISEIAAVTTKNAEDIFGRRIPA